MNYFFADMLHMNTIPVAEKEGEVSNKSSNKMMLEITSTILLRSH